MHYVSLSIHCFPGYLPPEPLSPSLCPSISSLLLILPLGALSIANQPANTHTRTHSQRDLLSGSAGCAAMLILMLYLLLYLLPLSVPHANVCSQFVAHMATAAQLPGETVNRFFVTFFVTFVT